MRSESTLKTKFLELMETADSIEVDGYFLRHLNLVPAISNNAEQVVIEERFFVDDDPVDFVLTNAELDEISLCEEGKIWSAGGFDVSFYNVTQIDTNPVL